MGNHRQDMKTIRRLIGEARTVDRPKFRLRLQSIDQRLRSEAGTDSLGSSIASLMQGLLRSIKAKEARRCGLPRLSYPENLPIVGRREEIIETLRNNRAVVITGETGSGKTTQIPKMCLEAGRGIEGMIGLTQPRRIAAMTVSRRIAEEMGEPLGRSVGYKIRFDDRTSRDSYIKIMTDGILLMEMQGDPLLSAYDTLIVDEAHERSINIDVILGHLIRLMNRRRDLSVIITSATIEPERFASAFGSAPIIEVSGRTYPVEVRYEPLEIGNNEGDGGYIDAAVASVEKVAREGGPGDILIFMPTEQDIRDTCDILAGRKLRNTNVLPLFGRLSPGDQQKVFTPMKGRKIIVATNVAETSITIPGIRYVIDTGLARIAEYSPSQRVKRLPVKVISRSSADQRAGRAGRLERGIAIRLYSEDDYLKRQRFTPPEILRANLAEVILRMTALSIPDVTAFPFIDPPPKKSINDGFALLKELGAIRQEERRFILTDQGKQMANLPVDPRLSRMIIESADRGCLEEILVIAAVLSIQDPRERPLDKEQAASQFHRSRMNPASDFITFLNLWRQYNATWEGKESKGTLRKFCRENFLSYRRMQEWRDIYSQLKELAAEILPSEKMHPTILIGEALHRAVHTSILRGFLSSIALKKERNIYRAPKGKELSIFPGSGLFNRGGAWIVAADIFETSRLYARVTATIDSAWIEEAGEPLLVKSYLAPHWDSKRGEVVAIQSVSLFGLPIASDRRVSYGSIDPEEASKIFVRSALVEGDLLVSFPFLDHNRETIERVRLLEAKIRRPAILVEESILARFYEKRLPGVYDVRTLRKLIKERESDRFLHMTENDVIRSLPDDELHEYPDNITVSASTLPLTYRFMPGDNSDGVTVNVPAHLDPRIPIEEAELAMPGLLKEKVAFLLKGLPKEYRRAIVPIQETLAAFLEAKDRYEGVLVARLSSFLREKRGVRVPGTAWSLESLPQHLKVRYALIDATGGEISASRDFPAIRNNRAEIPEPAVLISAKKDWERENITRWDFGDLPESISLSSTPCDVRAFPSLDAQGDAAAIRLFATPSAAADAHRRGVRRLFELHLKDRLRELKRGLSIPPATEKLARLLGMTANIEEIIISKVLDENFPLTLRTQKEFLAAMDSEKERLYAAGRSLGDQLAAILDAWQETRLLFGRLTANKSATPTVHKFIEDLRKDLSVLVPADFFLQYGPDDREQLPRYLKALRVRAERGTHNLPKEQAKADLLEFLYKKFRELSSTISAHTSPEKLHALKNLRWVFEEYKIALFAPEIKTLYPLSARRIEKILEDIEGMI